MALTSKRLGLESRESKSCCTRMKPALPLAQCIFSAIANVEASDPPTCGWTEARLSLLLAPRRRSVLSAQPAFLDFTIDRSPPAKFTMSPLPIRAALPAFAHKLESFKPFTVKVGEPQRLSDSKKVRKPS
jgi:hypothetical protein